MENYKVIFHVNEISNINSAYANINNILKDRDDIRISLLLNGSAASLSTSNSNLSDLITKKVEVSVCQNSLNANKITADDLIKGIKIVPSGVLELIYKQNEGYAYIKP